VGTRAGVNFLALLTVAADLAILTALVLAVGGQLSPALARARTSAADAVRPLALPFAAIVAIVATLGSLWLSEGANFLPCKLCWYQRIAMYPMAVVLPVAVLRGDDQRIRPYGWVLAGIGVTISTYHYLVERFPSLESSSCDPTNPCSLLWVWKFHFISIPFMAGSAFVLIAVLLALVPRTRTAPVPMETR
jgi:disulfide bond formation protein DsbB